MNTGPVLIALVVVSLAIAGCASRRPAPPAPTPPPVPAPPIVPVLPPDPVPAPPPVVVPAGPSDVTFTAGHSVLSRPITVRILGRGPEVVLFLSTIHGNESAGTPLLEGLADHLLAHPTLLAGRKVILVPVANPDGYRANRRQNSRGVDLNRNFPSVNFRDRATGGSRPLSEPETRALHALVNQHRPARVVSLHQPLVCIDHDGPAGPLARAMAEACDLPVKKLGGRPGSMGSWVGDDLGIPIVTVELPRAVDLVSPRELWRRYGPMLLVAVTAETPAVD